MPAGGRQKTKPKPVGTRAGVPLTPLEREAVRQTYVLTSNYRETARIHHLGERTVHKIIKDQSDPDEIKELRMQALQRMSKKTHDQALIVLENIKPKDMDKASLPQKAIAFGILTDKTIALDKHVMERQRQLQESKGDKQMLPASLDGLVAGIMREVNSVHVFAAHLQKAPEIDTLAQEARALQDMAIAQELVEPTGVTQIDDLDEVDEAAPRSQSGTS